MALLDLFVIADSISMHYGPYLAAYTGHAYRYARKSGEEAWLPETIRAQGGNGGDSTAVLAYLRAAQATGALRPDLLLLNCGLHDIRTDPASGAKQVPIDQYAENLAAILPLAQAIAVRLIWVRTTPVDEAMHNVDGRGFHRFNEDITAYNAVADAVMTAAGVAITDLHTFTNALSGERFLDGVHFTEPTRALQAAFLAGWLASS
jgi:lysophospholipase L1-like esterase